MTTYSSLILLAALGALTSSGIAQAAVDTTGWKCKTCPYPKGTTGTVEAGVGTTSADSARFGNYTGYDEKGTHAVLGGGLSVRGEDGYTASLSASDLGLDTRSLSLQTGRAGSYGLRLAYDELPRHFADGARTPYLGTGSGVLTLPSGFPADYTSAMPLASTLQPVALGFKKKRTDLSGVLLGSPNWTYRFSFSRDQRDGTKPSSIAFFSTAAQVALPVDQVNDRFEISAAYASRQWQASLAYQVSRFSSGIDSLRVDNPFSPVLGATRGQLALAPDNQLQQIVGTAGWQILPTLRVSADVAIGRLTQDAAYLPATINPALVVGVPAGSLDGKVDTFNGSIRLSARPLPDLRLTASASRNMRDNQTSRLSYALVATDMFVHPDTRENTPFDLTHDRFKASADYRGIEAVTISAGAEHDNRKRTFHEAVSTREGTFWGRLGVMPLDNLTVSVKVSHADRSNTGYGTSIWFGLPENPLMRKYNLAGRTRDTSGLRAELAVSETVSLGLTADYARDDYVGSAVGLTEARSVNVGADLSATLSEQTRLTAFVQSDNVRSRQAGSQAGGAADWRAQGRDRFDVLGVGLQQTLMGGKLELGADLSVSRAKSDIAMTASVADSSFPSAKTSRDTFKLRVGYQLQDNLWLNGSLWHERYKSQDWRLDGVLPDTVQNLLSFGAQAPQYDLNVVSVSLRYRF